MARAERREDREHSASLRFDRPVGEHLLSVGLDAASHRRDDWQALSGAYASDTRFAGRARQGTLWLQDEWQLAEALTLTSGLRGERIDRLRGYSALAQELGVAPGTLAIAWCLRNPHVSSVILGASRPEQLRENLTALELAGRYDEPVWARLTAAAD